MSEQEKQENQKTIIAFAAGLLIGGLLVWVFGGSPRAEDNGSENEDVNGAASEIIDLDTATDTDDELIGTTSEDTEDAAPVMQRGDGSVDVQDQSAGTRVTLDSATFPTDEGWIGVRDYVNGQPAGLLGVARYSKEQGLIPEQVILQRATRAGNTYAIVFYRESGDRVFSLADDVQIDGVFATFTAN